MGIALPAKVGQRVDVLGGVTFTNVWTPSALRNYVNVTVSRWE